MHFLQHVCIILKLFLMYELRFNHEGCSLTSLQEIQERSVLDLHFNCITWCKCVSDAGGGQWVEASHMPCFRFGFSGSECLPPDSWESYPHICSHALSCLHDRIRQHCSSAMRIMLKHTSQPSKLCVVNDLWPLCEWRKLPSPSHYMIISSGCPNTNAVSLL